MDLSNSGKLLKELRTAKNMTQKQIADELGILPKTISKWETGKGFPDVSVISELAEILEVSEKSLLKGKLIKNRYDSGNLKNLKFYVCPDCGSFFQGMGESIIICCGKALEPLIPKEPNEDHLFKISNIENDIFLEFDHEMTKNHFISFVAYTATDRVLTIKLYPEQNPEIRFPKTHRGKIYYYCNNHGLFEIDTKKEL